MSYNIDNWKLKKLDNFKISLDSIEALPYTECMIGIDHAKANAPMLFNAEGMSEGFELHGSIEDGTVTVVSLKNYGVGSGSTWDEFINMLSKSEGKLEAIMIWEGGDSITRLTVEDGEITDEPVEL